MNDIDGKFQNSISSNKSRVTPTLKIKEKKKKDEKRKIGRRVSPPKESCNKRVNLESR